MSDSISGRIVRGKEEGGKKVIFSFKGSLKPNDWDELIQRIQQILKAPEFQKVQLVKLQGDE
jgi:hypothetical protein